MAPANTASPSTPPAVRSARQSRTRGVSALRANHESLCRGGPPMAADGASVAHPRASTVRATNRACDACIAAASKGHETPASRGHKNGALRRHKKAAPKASGGINFSTAQLFCVGRSPFCVPPEAGFVSGRQGAAPKARRNGPSRPCDLGRGRTERTIPGLRQQSAPRSTGFRGRAQAPSS